MTISYEISRDDFTEWPPFTDGCPKCIAWHGAVVPYATFTQGDTLMAFYHHGRCGHEWFTAWGARYSNSWQRVIGNQQRSIAA